MSPWLVYLAVRADSFPRVSGDEPAGLWGQKGPWSFSPRERG